MRIKSSRRSKHKKILKLASGYRMARSKRYKSAHEAVMHAGQYAFVGRKLKKRDKKTEWVQQINSGLEQVAIHQNIKKMSYSVLIHQLQVSNISLNRKMLSNLSTQDFSTFQKIVEKVRI